MGRNIWGLILLLSAFLETAYSQIPNAYWPMQEAGGSNVIDSVSGNPSNIYGSYNWIIGEDLIGFDGTGTYIQVTDAAALNITGSITLSAWVEPNVSATRMAILSREYGGSTNYRLLVENNRVVFEFNNGTLSAFSGNTTILQDSLYHVAVTYDGINNPQIYVNGVNDAGFWITGTTGALPSMAANLSIGAASLGTVDFFNGALGHVRLYGSALAGNEIFSLYQFEASTMILPDNQLPNAFFPMEEGAGTYVYDTTGGNTGTLYGNAFFHGGEPGISFDGSGDYVDVPSNASLDITGSIAVTAWIHPFQNTNHQSIVSKRDASTANYHFGIDATGDLFFEWYAAGMWNTYSGPHIETNQWQQVSVRYNGTNAPEFHLDGTFFPGTNVSGGLHPLETNGAAMNIGASNFGGSEFFYGKIAYVRLYNEYLNPGLMDSIRIFDAPLFGATGGGGNLSAYWPTDEGSGTILNDSLGGSTGTLYGNAFFLAGLPAVAFDGGGDYIDIPSHAGLNVTGSITLSAWVRLNINTVNQSIISKKDATTANYNFGVNSSGNLYFEWYAAGMWNAYSGPYIGTGPWRHVAVRFNGTSSPEFFMDGTYFSGTNISGGIYPLETNPASVNIGAVDFGGTNFWNGEIGHVRVYKDTLMDSQIQAIRTAEQPLFAGGGGGGSGNLSAYWPTNEGSGTILNDSLGGSTGTLYGNTYFEGGNPALVFDGAGDYVEVAAHAGIDITGSITLSAWVNPNVNTVRQSIIAKKDASSANYSFGIDASGRLFFEWYASATWNAYAGPTVGTGAWQHVSVRFDASTMPEFYLDGVYHSSTNVSGGLYPMQTNPASVNIGAASFGAVDHFNGKIGHVRLYQDYLMPSQIDSVRAVEQSLFGGGGGGGGNLSAYWPTDEGSGTLLNDSLGGNTGTLYGNAFFLAGSPAVAFDGSGDYINVPNHAGLDVTGNITLSAWVRLNTNSVHQSIVSKRDASTSNYSFGINASGNLFFEWYAAGMWNTYSGPYVGTGTWHHAAVRFNGASAPEFFLDGTYFSGSNVAGGIYPLETNPASVNIGAADFGAVAFFNGDIGHVRVYKDNLMDSQIQDIRSEEQPLFGGGGGAGLLTVNPGPDNAALPSMGVHSGQDSVVMLQMEVWADPTEAVVLDTLGVRALAGVDKVVVTKLYEDIGTMPGIIDIGDRFVTTGNTMPDSTIVFDLNATADTLYPATSRRYLVGFSLAADVTPSDTFQVAMDWDMASGHGLSSVQPVFVDSMGSTSFSGPMHWGVQGLLTINPGPDNVSLPPMGVHPGQDSVVMLQMEIWADPTEVVVLDTLSVRAISGLGKVVATKLYEDIGTMPGIIDIGDRFVATGNTMPDSAIIFDLNAIADTLYPAMSRRYLVAFSLAADVTPSDTFQVAMDWDMAGGHGLSSGARVKTDSMGSISFSGPMHWGVQPLLFLNPGPENETIASGNLFPGSQNVVMMQLELTGDSLGNFRIDTLIVKEPYSSARVSQASLYWDNGTQPGLFDGSDMWLASSAPGTDSTFLFHVTPENHYVGPGMVERYLVLYSLDTLVSDTDSFQPYLAASGVLAWETNSSQALKADSIGSTSVIAPLRSGATPPDSTPPANVSQLSATPLDETRLAATWLASTSQDVDSLLLTWRTDGTYSFDPLDGSPFKMLGGSITMDTITGLLGKTTYWLSAFTRDSSGNWSAADSAARVAVTTPDLTPPEAPMGLTASASETVITIAWQLPPSDVAISRLLYRTDGRYPESPDDGAILRESQPAATADSLTGFDYGVTYYFALFLSDSAGNWSLADAGAQDTAFYMLPPDVTPPKNISQLSATPLDETRLAAAWLASTSQDVDSLLLTWRTDGTFSFDPLDGSPFKMLGGSMTVDTITGLLGKTTYWLSAFTRDSSGNWSAADSAARKVVTMPDLTPPAAPMGLTASASKTVITIAWQLPPSDVAISRLLYRTDGRYPEGPEDGAILRESQPATTADSLTGFDYGVTYHFALFLSDSAGNWSQPKDGAQDTAIYRPTAVGSLEILSQNGYLTKDSVQIHILGIQGDSLRIGPAKDSSSLAWKPFQSTILLPTAGLGEGTVTFVAQVKHSGGHRYDDLFAGASRDTKPPVVVPLIDSVYLAKAWPDSIHGTMMDSGSGVSRLEVKLVRLTDGKHFHDTVWNSDTSLVRLQGDKGKWKWMVPRAQLETGHHEFRYRATDHAGNTTGWIVRKFVYQKNRPPAFLTQPTAFSLKDNESLALTLKVTDPDADALNFRIDSTPLPLNLDSKSGALSYQAISNHIGEHVVRVAVTDGALTSHLDLRIKVEASNRMPMLQSANLPASVQQNSPVHFSVEFVDPDVMDSLVLKEKRIPAYLQSSTETRRKSDGAFAAKWTFTGTPKQENVGPDSLILILSDKQGLEVAFRKPLFVMDVNDPPAISAKTSSLTAVQDSLFALPLKGSDPDPKDTLRWHLAEAPAWLRVEGAMLKGTPANEDVGQSSLRLILSDGRLSDTLVAVIKVENRNDPPSIASSSGLDSLLRWKEDRADSFSVVVTDPDKGDSLWLLHTGLPSFLTLRGSSPQQKGRRFDFLVKPLQPDTGIQSFALVFRDRDGLTAKLNVRKRVEETNDAPMAIVASKMTSGGAARVLLDVSDEDGTLSETRFRYELKLGGATVARDSTASPVLQFHPLHDGRYHLTLTAIDRHGLAQTVPSVDSFTVTGVMQRSLDSARWLMIGIPGKTLSDSALGADAVYAHWQEDATVHKLFNRYRTEEQLDSLRPGNGYWAYLSKQVTLKAEFPLLQQQARKIPLLKRDLGWNQIANPYPYPVNLASSGLQFWEWDESARDMRDAGAILKPWSAYWVQAPKDTVLTLDGKPHFGGSALGKSSALLKTAYMGDGNWSLRLGIRAGAYRDESNYFGVKPLAKSASELLAEPPKMGDHLSLAFLKDEGGREGLYSADYRAAANNAEEWWDVVVINEKTGENKGLVTLDGLESLSQSGLHAFLVSQGDAQALKADEPVSLSMGEGRQYYSIVVTRNQDFAEGLRGSFHLSNNRPNPVRAFTEFRFYLPHAWSAEGKRLTRPYRVTLRIFDARGREMDNVFQGELAAGAHNLRWTPENKGRRMSSGQYFYRLEAEGFGASRRLILAP